MAIPTELGVSFTSAEIDSMKAAAKVITDLIRSKKILNLTNAEKSGKLSTVSDDRSPFVLKSIGNYGIAFPGLNGLAHPHVNAIADMSTYGDLFEVKTAIAEATEVVEEMHMVAGHFCFQFMTDQYYNAKRYLGDNVDGAQIVYDGLKDCFEGQGAQPDDDSSEPDPANTPD